MRRSRGIFRYASAGPLLEFSRRGLGGNRGCGSFMQMFPEICAALESPAIAEKTKEKEALDLPWNVVVHNDPVNLMSYVTMVFQKVFGYPREKAEMHMLEVHHKGRSILWSGVRERAELFVQQLHDYLLLATIERTN